MCILKVGFDLSIHYTDKNPLQHRQTPENEAECEQNRNSSKPENLNGEREAIEIGRDDPGTQQGQELRHYIRQVLQDFIETDELKEKLNTKFIEQIRTEKVGRKK